MDNKYANLPGIARNEPDVYETTNLVQPAGNDMSNNEDDSQNVQKINLSAREAREKFADTNLNSEFADFSDTITNRRKIGYLVEPDNYEWDLIESPLQRFKRLEKELNELKSDVASINSTEDEELKQQLLNCDPIDLLKKIEDLQSQTANLHLQSIGLKSDASSLDNKTKKKALMDHLNQLKGKLNTTKETGEKKNTDVSTIGDSSVVFKLFADLDFDDLQQAKRIADLNQRLAAIEKIFGSSDIQVSERQISTLCSNIDSKSMLGLIENLQTKLDLISTQSVEQLDGRLQLILQRVQQLNEKKSLIEDQEKLQRVNELYTMISRWKDISAAVPNIVERLNSLSELHEKALQFSSILTRIDTEQSATKEKIESSNDLLNQLKTNLESNLESIKSNFEVLNKRIEKISAK